MSIFSSMDVSASGLTAQRLRMDVISNNIANVDTTRTPEGGPYRRQRVIFEARGYEPVFSLPLKGRLLDALSGVDARPGNGVRVSKIDKDSSAPKLAYNPGHPDANEQGYVLMPNISIVTEMVDMISASRSYEANVTAVSAAKELLASALRIGSGGR